MMKIKIHGTGNAWPVLLGEDHPFYNRSRREELANAAFSLYIEEIKEILVDAGHGTIQSLITSTNRIPEAICLTHGHLDHTLSVDWIVQSYYKKHHKEKTYPLYASLPVYQVLVRTYPQLSGLIDFRELIPGLKTDVQELPGLSLTAFPVYHGKSGFGACMLLFESEGRRVLFTGDLLTPLLRPADYEGLKHLDMLVVDANNRFPWPRTNHWSIVGSPGEDRGRALALKDFISSARPEEFVRMHSSLEDTALEDQAVELGSAYFSEFLKGYRDDQPFTIFEFVKRISPEEIMLVHYSGLEDQKYHHEAILDRAGLEGWVTSRAEKEGIGSRFIVPRI